MTVKTKHTHNGWAVLVDGVIVVENLTLHQAERIAVNIRLDIKRGVYFQ